MRKWFARHRLAKAVCLVAPVTLLLAGCNTGYDPGMAVGGRCMATTGAPNSPNYFSYTPDCPNGITAGPDHWIYKVWKAGYPDLQEGAIGLTDKTVSPVPPNPNRTSHFQTTWYKDTNGLAVEMWLKPNYVDDAGGQVDFDIANTATGGIPGLHSHHEIAMYGHTGTFQTSYILLFTVGTDHYWLNYILPPHTTKPQVGLPPGIMYQRDWTDNGGVDWNHIVNFEASYFKPSLNLMNGWNTVDIDWTELVDYLHSQNLWLSLNVNATKGHSVEEDFYASGFGPTNGPLGGVDTVQRNWTMSYS